MRVCAEEVSYKIMAERTTQKRKPDRRSLHLRVPAGSRKSMLVRIGLELWRSGRLDLSQFIQARGREVRSEDQALRVLVRSSTADIEPAVLSSLNGDSITIEGRIDGLGSPERGLLERLGVEVEEELEQDGDRREPIRFIDMTPALMGLAAIVMAARYIALGMGDRELYVMAGIGYASFILIRTFSYKLRRPRNAPTPELPYPYPHP